MAISFTKMHGIGNDFVLLDGRDPTALPEDLSQLGVEMCDRRLGIGADGLLILQDEHDGFRMKIINSDGSEAAMCGNGSRCFALYMQHLGLLEGNFARFVAGPRTIECELLEDGQVRVDMGIAVLDPSEIGMVTNDMSKPFIDQSLSSIGFDLVGTAVSMGNPHFVAFYEIQPSPDTIEVIGPLFERHPAFPDGVNVHLVEVNSRAHITQHTWERGAGKTQACGTGACASVVAGVTTNRTERRCRVSLPGGNLEIDYQEDGRVFMTGPALTVFTGIWI